MKVTITGHRQLTSFLANEAYNLGRNLTINKSVDTIYIGGIMGADTEVLKGIIAESGEGKVNIVVPNLVENQPAVARKMIEKASLKGARVTEMKQSIKSLVEGYGYLNRNKYMLDRSDIVFAVWDGRKKGGTWYTINEARRRNIKCVYPNEFFNLVIDELKALKSELANAT